MQALKAQDRDAFLAAEAEMRELSGLPPYGRLAALILSSPDGAKLADYAKALAAAIPNADGLEVYGPVDAPPGLDPGGAAEAVPGAGGQGRGPAGLSHRMAGAGQAAGGGAAADRRGPL